MTRLALQGVTAYGGAVSSLAPATEKSAHEDRHRL